MNIADIVFGEIYLYKPEDVQVVVVHIDYLSGNVFVRELSYQPYRRVMVKPSELEFFDY
jgi:hypothetical protein